MLLMQSSCISAKYIPVHYLLLTINHTVDYMARGFMSFIRGVDITRAIGRVGLKVEPVLGPEFTRATASAIWAQNSHIINSLIGNFIQMRTEWMFQGPNNSRP